MDYPKVAIGHKNKLPMEMELTVSMRFEMFQNFNDIFSYLNI